jgi:hypothetical protein
LSEEKRSCQLEGDRIREFHHLFEQVKYILSSAVLHQLRKLLSEEKRSCQLEEDRTPNPKGRLF